MGQNQTLTIRSISLRAEVISAFRIVFAAQKRCQNPIFTYTLSYTQLGDARKSLMANRDRSVQSSHNPLVLGSNPSGPRLSPKTDSQPIRCSCRKGRVVKTDYRPREPGWAQGESGKRFASTRN